MKPPDGTYNRPLTKFITPENLTAQIFLLTARLSRWSLIIVLIFVCNTSLGQNTREKIQDQMFSDTLGVSKSFQKTELQSHAFYDTMLRSKSWFVRTVANLLVGSRSSADDAYAIKETVVSRDYFTTFAGRVITKINIVNVNIFSRTDDDDLSWTERALESLHVKTKYDVILKNLLFNVGQEIDPYKMAINEQLLRNKPYLATAFFILINDKNHPGGVVVNVFARDNWTISAAGMLGGNPFGSVFDRNFVGSGNMLKFTYYPKTDNQYDTFEAQYVINNLGGTFADATLQVGIGGTNNSALLDLNRQFILPSDHIWGVRLGYVEQKEGMTTFDSTLQVKKEEFGVYYGYSFNLDSNMGTTAYFTVAPNFQKFTRSLKSTLTTHPYYTDRLSVMGNIGVSQQNFFQGNMIYGYGRTEDVPYGFKLELVGGWERNLTLGDRWYIGAQGRWGNLTKAGYFDVGLDGGTFIRDNKPEQSQLRFQLKYFSPLFQVNDFYMRQFININYTHGFHRFQGEREALDYRYIRGIGAPYQFKGINRFTVNTETVLFTPIFLYHFRFAFFGWWDMGWLGNNNVFFKNEFSSAIGLGVRIKNERLIFNNIQLRFGVSLKRPSGAGFSWFDITNESALQVEPFTPQPAQVREFN